ncbi:MAG: CRISPR-associated endoribonuclease Cse3 [Syntrophomonadaceae bacterium]|nr:CRISPR-associated endoribonuclease Cse3 [Bacillota bacterium]
MYLSRLTLNPASRQVQRDIADCQALHSTILKAFPLKVPDNGGAREQFGVLYRAYVDKQGNMHLYVQSHVAPDWQFLRPDYTAAPPVFKPIGELYERITSGTCLGFTLRANTTRKTGTTSKTERIQGVQKSNGRRVFLTRFEEQLEWLERKAQGCGFKVLAVNLRHDDSRGRHAASHRLRFLGVVFEGTLTVTDRVLFLDALRQGIGPGKAYGFGLLSVAPRARG